jgi:hypothetical protein
LSRELLVGLCVPEHQDGEIVVIRLTVPQFKASPLNGIDEARTSILGRRGCVILKFAELRSHAGRCMQGNPRHRGGVAVLSGPALTTGNLRDGGDCVIQRFN